MADVNANIGVNIDTSNALAQLKALQRQISQFHTSVAKSSEAAALAQKSLQRNLLNSVNAIGAFSAELRNVKTTAESFTTSLEGNKFSMREYFRYAAASTRTFGRLFKSEFDTIGKVAEERVKTLQTQYIKLGRDTSGAMKALAIMPAELDLNNYSTQAQIAAQKQALFNQLMRQGSTNLLNFGKNTQWAGRQLMVGFTLPLITFGGAASKAFMDLEAQALKFKKVYGDLGTTQQETNAQLDNIKELGKQYTQYGVALSKTVGLAADAAAAGFQGLDLQRQTAAATKLSILGQIDSQQALQTTISLQNAFGTSSADLASNIDFLNAVENQTVTSLDDITIAIPKVAPVIRQLGGNVKDLAFFLTAMKEGGVNASEGANALKSGLASLINPTKKASDMLASVGINIREIVQKNKGDLKQTVIDFAKSLDTLAPLDRARAIEQLFGKFQFARISTLLQNVTRDGTQAARVLDLANASVADLASLSEKELGVTANSAMNRFKKAVEDLRIALVPVGETFLKAVTPIIDFARGVLERFNNLSDGAKKFITLLTVGIGAIGPVLLMTFGLLANGVANIIKLFLTLRSGYLRLTGQSKILGEQTQYLTTEQLNAAAAAHSLDQSHATLTQTFNVEKAALDQLAQAYLSAARAGATFAMNNPGMMLPPRFRGRGYAKGGEVIVVPGSGDGDTVPAMLTPGETVIPKEMSKRYAGLIQAMVAGNIPGYQQGRIGRSASGGELRQRNVIGGYQLGHFAPPTQMSGQELVEFAKTQSQSFQRAVDLLINSVTDGLTHMFDVFTNEVTAQSQELNQLLGEVGSGQTAPIEMFRKESVAQSTAYNAPLLARLKKAGASTEELQNVANQLATEFESGISELGDQVNITAEQVNEITQKAYRKVAETNKAVANALEEMNQPGALKEVTGVTSGRTSARGGYNTPSQRGQVANLMQELAPGVYPAQQAFQFTGEAARKVGLQNANAIAAVYDQLSQDAKLRVQALLGNIEAMSQQVIIEAQNAGISLAEYTVKGVAEGVKTGTEQGIKEVAQVASPSEETKRIGGEIGRGAIIGMEGYIDDAKVVGEQIGSAIINPKTNRPFTQSERNAIIGGPTVTQVAGSLPLSKETLDQGQKNLKVMKTMDERISNLNKAIMGGSFALTALSSMASFSSGALGDFAGKIAPLSGAMFGLMTITQLLTQTQIAKLAMDRIGLAKGAIVSAREAGSAVAGVAGRAGFLGSLGRVGLFSKVLLGLTSPLGLVAAGLTVTAGLIFVSNKLREKERKAIEDFGNIAVLTKDKLKTLGDFFGIVPQKFGFETIGQGGKQVAMSAQQRTQVQQLRELPQFQKQFGSDITALRTATKEDAGLILKNLALQLKGRGFAEEQIKTIIDALREEGKQTDVVIDLKSITLDTKEGRADVKKTTDEFIKNFTKSYKTGLKKELQTVSNVPAEQLAKMTEAQLRSIQTKTVEAFVPTKAFKKEISTASKALTSTIGSITQQYKDAKITSEQFDQSLSDVSKSISKIPAPAALILTNAILRQMGTDEKIVKAAEGIGDINTKMKVLTAIALGAIEPTEQFMDALAGKKGSLAQFQASRHLDDAIAKFRKAQNEINKAVIEGTKEIPGDGGTNKVKTLQDLIKENRANLQTIEDQATAVKKLTKAGFTAEQALRLVANAEDAAAIAGTKVKYTRAQWEEYIKTLKKARAALLSTTDGAKQAFDNAYSAAQDYFNAQEALQKLQRKSGADVLQKQIDAQQTLVNQAQEKIDKEQRSIDNNNHIIDLYNRQIDLKYDRPIKALNDQATILQNNLTIIGHQEQAINDKYDQQTKALEQVSKINQQLINQEKSRLNIAGALSQGDIAAAAQAAQEARAQQAADQTQSAQNALDAARNAELARLTAGGMTKTQIEEKLYQIGQQTFALEQQKKTLQDQILLLQDQNWQYEQNIYNIKVNSLIPAQDALNKTTQQLEEYNKQTESLLTQIKYLGLTKTEWDNNKVVVDAAYTSIKSVETSLKESYKAAKNIFDTWTKLDGKTITIRQNVITTYTTVGVKKASGGMIPEYFGQGGSPLGSDIIPAMLTPGEFVVNRVATQKNKSLLEAINSGQVSQYKLKNSFGEPSFGASSNSVTTIPIRNSLSNINTSNAVYNYSVGINVGSSNAGADTIAREVINQIKYIDSQRIRGQK